MGIILELSLTRNESKKDREWRGSYTHRLLVITRVLERIHGLFDLTTRVRVVRALGATLAAGSGSALATPSGALMAAVRVPPPIRTKPSRATAFSPLWPAYRQAQSVWT